MRKEIKGICSTYVAGVVLKILFVTVFVAVSTVFTASPEDATLSFQHKLVLMGKGQERVASWQFSLDIKTKHAKIHSLLRFRHTKKAAVCSSVSFSRLDCMRELQILSAPLF